MKREWKPGDVAIALYPEWVAGAEPNYVETRVSRYDRGWARLDDPDDFLNDDGLRPGITVLRPLVVIDPEDRDQVEALRDSLRPENAAGMGWQWVQQALRSLLAPPRPDEPTGLGAVVEDAEGRQWIRAARIAHGWHRPMGTWAKWSDITAVKVLSEGVS